MRKKQIAVLLLTAAMGLLAACGPEAASGTSSSPTPSAPPSVPPSTSGGPDGAEGGEELKVALLLNNVITDGGWDESAYRGFKEAEEKYGFTGAYTESISLPDQEAVLRNYLDNGFDIIVAASTGYSPTLLEIAPEYPDAKLIAINGEQAQDPNLAVFRPNTPQCGFLAGAFAGLVTETDKVGMVVGEKSPPGMDAAMGFEAGAKYVNPDIQDVQVVYVDNWSDVAKASESATAMIESGVDVIAPNCGSGALGVIEVSKKAGTVVVGYVGDQYEIAPGTVAVSAIQDVGAIVVSSIEYAMSSDFKGELHLVGAPENVIRLSAFHEMGGAPVPDAVVEKMEEIYQGILDGSLKEQGILPLSGFEK